MTRARFALSSLYFRSSPLPEPVLSVVATLFVCVMLPLREMFPRPSVLRRLTDSGREDGEPDPADDNETSEGRRPWSTIVGRRERVGGISVGGPPYSDSVWAWD